MEPNEQERRAARNRANGQNGGCPEGSAHSDKRTYPAAQLADKLANAIISGKSLPISPMTRSGPITEDDRATIVRIAGKTVEEFQAMISAKLQRVADAAADLALAKLTGDQADAQKLSDVNMSMAISLDKLAALSGRQSSSGNISVQINNFGAMSREQLIAQAKGAHNAINVTPSPSPSNPQDERAA